MAAAWQTSIPTEKSTILTNLHIFISVMYIVFSSKELEK